MLTFITGSSNVTTMFAPTDTFEPLFEGEVTRTPGENVSAPVVNVIMKSIARGMPAISVMPVVTRPVYAWFGNSWSCGSKSA